MHMRRAVKKTHCDSVTLRQDHTGRHRRMRRGTAADAAGHGHRSADGKAWEARRSSESRTSCRPDDGSP